MKVTRFTSILPAAVLAAGLLLPATTRAADPDYTLSLDPPSTTAPPAEESLNTTADAPQSLALLDAATLPAADTSPFPNKLQLSFELPIWFSGINGTAGVRGRTVATNADFTQILDATDSIVGLGGRIEADYGHWIFFGSGLYMKLTKDNVGPGPVSINFINELTIADAGILYKIGQWNLSGQGGSAAPSVAVAAGAAARYMHVGLQLNPLRVASRQATEDWADPLFAAQITLDLNKHWQLLCRGDVGGGSSQLTWSTGLFLGYHFNFTNSVSGIAKIGYEAVSEDFTSGSGNQKFTWDEILHGPLISFAVQF